jgi:hypothetical protein
MSLGNGNASIPGSTTNTSSPAFVVRALRYGYLLMKKEGIGVNAQDRRSKAGAHFFFDNKMNNFI